MKKPLTVAHLTSVHAPDDVRIFLKECQTLAAAGYTTYLVAPADGDADHAGVGLRAVPRLAGRRERMTRTPWLVYRRAVALDADVYHFHDPELIPVGMLLRARGKRVIYDAHEDLARAIFSKEWVPAPLRRAVSLAARLLEGAGAAVFDAVVAATPSIARRFPAAKTATVQNFPRLSELPGAGGEPAEVAIAGAREELVVYVGGIEEIRGARQMVEAAALWPAGVRLALLGRIDPPALASDLAALPGWERVDSHGWCSREHVRGVMERARAALVVFHPVPNHVEAQPNKLFEYMSAGVPVIASDFPLWRKIVEGVGCGLLVPPLDPQAIADAVRWLFEHPAEAAEMGRRGREAVRAHYNWESETPKLLATYARLVGMPTAADETSAPSLRTRAV